MSQQQALIQLGSLFNAPVTQGLAGIFEQNDGEPLTVPAGGLIRISYCSLAASVVGLVIERGGALGIPVILNGGQAVPALTAGEFLWEVRPGDVVDVIVGTASAAALCNVSLVKGGVV